jgi:hypothetical protein
MLRSRAAAVVLAVLVVVAAVAAWRLLRTPPGDEDQIRALFDRAARAAEERRVGDAVEDVSERFRGQGLDRHGLKQFVAYQAMRGTWSAVVILGSQVRVDGDRAEAVVDVALVRSGSGSALADRLPAAGSTWRIDAALEREGRRWRVTGAAWRPVSAEEAVAGPSGPR